MARPVVLLLLALVLTGVGAFWLGGRAAADPAPVAPAGPGTSARERAPAAPRPPAAAAPSESLAAALAEADPERRRERLLARLATASREDHATLPGLLVRFADHLQPADVELAMTHWVAADPAAALAGARMLIPGMDEVAVAAVLRGRLPTDAAAMAEELRGVDAGARADAGLVSALMAAWSESDPAAARAWVAALPPANPLRRLAAEAVSIHAVQAEGIDAALAWAASVDDPELRGSALRPLVKASSRADYRKLATWLEVNLREEDDLEIAAIVMHHWARADPEAASRYLLEARQEGGRERFVPAFAAGVAVHDPGGALEWASSVGHESLRREAMVDVVRTWEGRERGAVRRWAAAQTGLTPAARAELDAVIQREALPEEAPEPGPGAR